MKAIEETNFFLALMEKLGLQVTDRYIKSITIKIGHDHSPYMVVEKFINQEEAEGMKEIFDLYKIEKIQDTIDTGTYKAD